MIRTTLIALSAAGAMSVALAPAAEAKTHLNIDVGFGLGGPVYVGGPAYDDGWYGDDCQYVTVKHKSWNKWHTKKVVWFSKELVCE